MSQPSLKAYHDRLYKHFSWLRSERAGASQERPIFALEHGLSEAERQSLGSVVRDTIRRGIHPQADWLPLVVYATEIGYEYSGDEYWQTFERKSPGWSERGDRSYIRRKFWVFAQQFGGAVPRGPWAEHFSIIAWPITHAILPTDLQRHLARLLFEMRHEISLELLAAPEQFGRRLASRGLYTSARFQKFAENHALLGVVAAGLLREEHEESRDLFEPTLDRIVNDLSSEHQARSWLRGARRTASRVRVRGARRTPVDGGSGRDGQRDPASRPGTTDLSVWVQKVDEGWVLEIELPNLSEIGSRLPQVQEELARKRCRISGRRQPLARGRVLYPGQRVSLDFCPDTGRSMLEIVNGSSEAQAVLREHCLLTAPPWLFRIDEDGLGREIKGRFVRPGRTYLYVTSTPVSFEEELLSRVPLQSSGLIAYLLETPDLLDAETRSVLARLGLRNTTDVTVVPVGVVPAYWDYEGVAAWMAGDEPILAVHSSGQPKSAVIEVDQSETNVDWPQGESCVYIRLRDMDVGTHNVRLRLTFGEGGAAPVDAELSIVIRPRPSGIMNWRYGIRLLTTPAKPYLTELWDGKAFVEAQGPPGLRATVQCDLRGRDPDRSLARHSFRVSLPVGRSEWQRAFRREVHGNDEMVNAYDEADICRVSVYHPKVGVAEVRLERPFTALRWVIRSARNKTVARLINNSGADRPEIKLFQKESPAEPGWVARGSDGDETVHASSGGLLVAETGELWGSVILPPEVRDLADLRGISKSPALRNYASRSERTVEAIIRDCGRWSAADVPANLYAQRLLHTVVRAFASRLCEVVGGRYWSRVERRVRDDGDLNRNLFFEAMGAHARDEELAREIWKRIEPLRQLGPERRADMLAQVVRGFVRAPGRATLDAYSIEQVLELTSEPGRLAGRNSREADAATNLVVHRPIILRAARMTVLCVHSVEEFDDGSVYRGWAWQ